MNNSNYVTKYPIPSKELTDKYSSKKTSFYCYYPMNGLWDESKNTQNTYIDSIDETFGGDKKKPIALYIHFPFCKTQCMFCHCFTIISNNEKDHNKIIDYLIKEVEILKNIFKKKGYLPNIKEIHFGGGSPSNLSNANFSRLFDAIKSLSLTTEFDTCALEVDPRYEVDVEKMHFYADQGVSRISFGIQDFDEKIGKIINRKNSPEMIKKLIPKEVRNRFEGINFDLIFGMPEQTMESWLKTIDKTIELDPDRLAVYVWGFRPDLYKHMKALEKYKRADYFTQMQMFSNAINKFLDSGYRFIGLDHMAKENDVLSVATREKTIDRNALSHSSGKAADILAIGPNSMSSFGKSYFQNFHSLPKYYSYIDSGQLPLVRGFTANDDDMLRRDIIFTLICHSSIDFRKVEKDHNIKSFKDYFAFELSNELKIMQNDDLVKINSDGIIVTNLGRLFMRHICRVFDIYDREVGYKYSREFEDGIEGFDRKSQLSR